MRITIKTRDGGAVVECRKAFPRRACPLRLDPWAARERAFERIEREIDVMEQLRAMEAAQAAKL